MNGYVKYNFDQDGCQILSSGENGSILIALWVGLSLTELPIIASVIPLHWNLKIA